MASSVGDKGYRLRPKLRKFRTERRELTEKTDQTWVGKVEMALFHWESEFSNFHTLASGDSWEHYVRDTTTLWVSDLGLRIGLPKPANFPSIARLFGPYYQVFLVDNEWLLAQHATEFRWIRADLNVGDLESPASKLIEHFRLAFDELELLMEAELQPKRVIHNLLKYLP